MDSPAHRDASPFFAVDVENWDGSTIEFQSDAGFPIQSVMELGSGYQRS